MGERTNYDNGTFNWVELGTDDPGGARDFYGALLGWEYESLPSGHGDYSICRLRGQKAAAIVQRGEKQPLNAWISYVAADDVDATSAEVAEHGGSVEAGPFDLGEAGRAAYITDPTGAALGLWQAGDHFGAEIVNDPGAMCMNQLFTADPSAAEAFFGSLFGWRAEDTGTEEVPFWTFFRDETTDSMNATMGALGPGENGPAYWLPYFTVETLDDSLEQVRIGGGKVEMAAEIEDGRIAILRDPQGAYFALFEGEVDP